MDSLKSYAKCCLYMCVCVFLGDVLWLSSDFQGLNKVKGPLPPSHDTVGQAEMVPLSSSSSALAHLLCGQPLDLQLLDAVSFLQTLEAVLCAYLKTLSTLTKPKDFLLHSLQMFKASPARFWTWPINVPHSSLVGDLPHPP